MGVLLPSRPDISRGRLNRAGETLRAWWRDEIEPGPELVEAYDLMLLWRETFQLPLSKTATGLRSMVRSEWPEKKEPGVPIPVVQRLKRSEQIMFKLARMPQSELTNMGDIGGLSRRSPGSRDG